MSTLSFWNAFFGTEIKKPIRNISDLFDTTRAYQHDFYGKKTAIWMDTSKPFKAYIEIPELRTVVDKKAQMLANGKPRLVKESDGSEVESHWVLDLIKNPNPMQSWQDVIYSISVNDSLYSTALCYAPKRSFGIVNLFVPLATHKVQINTSGRSLKQMEKGGLIKDYVYNFNEDNKELLTNDEVIIIQTTDGVNILNSVSKIESLKYPLSNIKAQYNKRNVLLENIGAIGILSAVNSDLGGALPMSPEEREQIQRDWYNRSKDELIISESDVKWTPMSFPTKDLMLFDELKADKLAIIDAFGLNYYIFSNESGSTYSNVNYGERLCYTSTIIPESNRIYDNITEQLGLEKEGLRLTADFEHLPVLQKDFLQESQSVDYRASALIKIQTELGINLTDDEKKVFLGLKKGVNK
jgi:hypothetical protein